MIKKYNYSGGKLVGAGGGGFFLMVTKNKKLVKKRLKIFDSKLTSEKSHKEPGTVICMNEKILVSCSDFYLQIIEVQLEGKKKMSALDWFRGKNEEFGFKFD